MDPQVEIDLYEEDVDNDDISCVRVGVFGNPKVLVGLLILF